jgi:hypothetical protein
MTVARIRAAVGGNERRRVEEGLIHRRGGGSGDGVTGSSTATSRQGKSWNKQAGRGEGRDVGGEGWPAAVPSSERWLGCLPGD